MTFWACYSNSAIKSLERGVHNSARWKGQRIDKEARVLARDSWMYGEDAGEGLLGFLRSTMTQVNV